jgi:hypothetical protein
VVPGFHALPVLLVPGQAFLVAGELAGEQVTHGPRIGGPGRRAPATGMGASEGAKASLVAAARLGHGVRGVVSLSAETVLLPDIEVVRSVARLRPPLLLVTSAQDPYGFLVRQTREWGSTCG